MEEVKPYRTYVVVLMFLGYLFGPVGFIWAISTQIPTWQTETVTVTANHDGMCKVKTSDGEKDLGPNCPLKEGHRILVQFHKGDSSVRRVLVN